MSFRSPLGRVKGLGAGGGTEHWWSQRLTGIALVPLTFWFVYSVLQITDLSVYLDAVAWLENPLNAFMIISFITVALYHGLLGIQVVIEDYVHKEAVKMLLLITAKLGIYFMGAAALFSILSVYFRG